MKITYCEQSGLARFFIDKETRKVPFNFRSLRRWNSLQVRLINTTIGWDAIDSWEWPFRIPVWNTCWLRRHIHDVGGRCWRLCWCRCRLPFNLYWFIFAEFLSVEPYHTDCVRMLFQKKSFKKLFNRHLQSSKLISAYQRKSVICCL